MTEPELIYEDSDMLAINKPSGLLTMPGRGGLASAKSALSILRVSRGPLFVVHRLDKDASGLMLFARNAEAHRYYSGLFETRDITKKYLAAVDGLIAAQNGEIDKPLVQGGSGRVSVAFDGKASVTRYETLEHYKNSTLLEVSILSGRRHQIRVHLYSIGHPIIGDRVYGDQEKQKQWPRLMLHAYELKFNDRNGKKQAFRADPPKDFMSVLPFL
ncbi:MAG TPA: RluA family pseudouridine synthase [Elusimicrobia bacterium]|nr:RluA family pseudouridine synthase [Elusimicrobiota bacterium]